MFATTSKIFQIRPEVEQKGGKRSSKFFRAGKNQSETQAKGIGLAVCQNLIDRHEAEIWAETEVGKGTAFNSSLPRSYCSISPGKFGT
ncbi:MAG: ATP-binding protein [Halobacteria archaeon]